MEPIVIVGSGLAGISLLRELRKLDRDVPVVVVTGDDGAFYAKPNLSNALALGKEAAQLVQTPAAKLSEQLNAEIRTHTQVRAIRVNDRTLETSGGEVRYGRLVLAAGAHPIRLPLQGDAADAVLSVNSLADYGVFRSRLIGKRRVAILGAGLIGCEFANDLCAAGFEVDVFDLAPQPLGRLLPTQAAALLREELERAGIRFHLQRSVARVETLDDGYRLTDDKGEICDADLVLSAVGLRPAVELAAAAGLKVNRGIVADEFLRTSAADVFTLGDCAEVEGQVLPFVQPILNAARALAQTLAGKPASLRYPVMPVVVKTPACPTVVCPPPQGVQGEWKETVLENGVRALFAGSGGQLSGFALAGAEPVKERATLAAQMVPA